MSIAITRAAKRPPRPTLSPEKGRELTALLMLALGALLAFSLATYDPRDASLMHRLASTGGGARNWVGVVGSEVGAVGFGFFGLTAFLVPLFLLVAGWRRLRRRDAVRVVGRGFGAALLLAALPPLAQLTAANVPWRGALVPAGGAFGAVLAGLLRERLDFTGSLVVLAAAAAGGTLVVQSTLGELLSSWRAGLRAFWQARALARERRRERREKERARRRVITKHLQRVVEEKQAEQR